jgi:DNA-binding transcriptional LysR family regulator
MEPEDSLPALKLGELDLVLAQEYAFAPNPPDPALERTDLLDDPLRVALPQDHPLADKDTVDIKALDAEPWIAGREGSFCHLVVIHSTRAAGYEPRLAHLTNDFDVSYALVQAGAGVGLVPELAGPPPPGVVVRPIRGAPPSRRIYAAVRAGSGARPAIAAMLNALTARGSRAPSRASSPGP